jgi:hypothetical protein
MMLKITGAFSLAMLGYWNMVEWLNRARELQVRDELRRHKHPEPDKKRTEEILASEADWMERVAKRVLEIAEQYVYIQIKRLPKGVKLEGRGTVEIEFLGHKNFTIRFRDISKPSHVMINRPLRIYHHRLAKVRELNSHNVEEVVKFAALGTEHYIQIASFQRIERNLDALISAVNDDEHVEGPAARKKPH